MRLIDSAASDNALLIRPSAESELHLETTTHEVSKLEGGRSNLIYRPSLTIQRLSKVKAAVEHLKGF